MIANVCRAGFLTTVQDLGRTGARRYGVSVGGALDSFAMRVANLLVGNDPSMAALEVTFGGLELSFDDKRLLAWCGGEFDVSVNSHSMPSGHPVLVAPNQQVKFGAARIGCRCWLAISGGVDVPVVIGSRSTDLRSKFGGFEGRALKDGDCLRLGQNSERANRLMTRLIQRRVGNWAPPHDWANPARRLSHLHIIRGTDWNLFDNFIIEQMMKLRFVVSPDSDRMGVRLESSQVELRHGHDLSSEPVAPGTIQVPPSGLPILLLGDCQTIGGYPKIAHVITVDLASAAQLRAGDQISFTEVSISVAHRHLINRENEFERFRYGLEAYFT